VSGAFVEKYGPWAMIAGASEGIGEAFAVELAGRGLNLVLVARREQPLNGLAARLQSQFRIQTRTVVLDLGDAALAEKITSATRELEIGLVVYNAAQSFIGSFLAQPLAEKLRIVDVNCRGPLILADIFGRAMAARGRGGVILLTSLAALQGSPLIATYAASKAFNLVLGEALWDELGRAGVDAIACCAGATRTPGFERSKPRGGPTPMDPAQVPVEALAALGRRPSVVVGWFNRFAAFVMVRLFPRKTAVTIMGSQARRMYAG
jgi:uncharacterized protein